MKENRNNSRDSRRAPLYHGRSADRFVIQYDGNLNSRYERNSVPRRFEDNPVIIINPLGIAFGYMTLPVMLRRSG